MPELDRLFSDACAEAERAMAKFPQPNYTLLKVAEETGEVVKAAVHFGEVRGSRDEVRKEIVQAIAMIFRLYLEGDQINGVPGIAEQAGGGKPVAERCEALWRKAVEYEQAFVLATRDLSQPGELISVSLVPGFLIRAFGNLSAGKAMDEQQVFLIGAKLKTEAVLSFLIHFFRNGDTKNGIPPIAEASHA